MKKSPNKTCKRMRHFTDHACAALAGLWSLRVLVDLGGWRSLTSKPLAGFDDDTLWRNIGLPHPEDDETGSKDLHSRLTRQQVVIERRDNRPSPVFRRNLQNLEKLLGLSRTETTLLTFAVTLHSHRGLQEACETLGELTGEGVIQALAVILDLPAGRIRKALSAEGRLTRAEIVRLSNGNTDGNPGGLFNTHRMIDRLRLLDRFATVLFSPAATSEELLGDYFRKAPAARLGREDFAHIQQDYRLIRRYLRNARKYRLRGVNIMIHGLPGTGKSELARTLAADTGADLYEVATVDSDGGPVTGNHRFNAFRLAQEILSRRNKGIILFDEIEDVFPSGRSPFSAPPPSDERNKAWVNRTLESNPVPAFWISNAIGQIDPAFLRRFDIVLRMDPPPRNTRLRILNRHLEGLPVSGAWKESVAECATLTPGVVARAARVVTTLGLTDRQNAEAGLERLFTHTLEAMGHEVNLHGQAPGPLPYALDVLNTDRDLGPLMKRLKRHTSGRLLIHGPPGSGKTAFARFVARQLDRPILLKTAGDLLGPYVGETEQNIAAMFRQARNDDSVLLLDEADGLLRDRTGALRLWEVTQVNELLTRMEAFDGLFICSTNRLESLDRAALRRFELKIRFDTMGPEQMWRMFRRTLRAHGATPKASHRLRLERLTGVTPGDFAAIVRQARISGETLTPDLLLEGLAREVSFKQTESRGIGFMAAL